MSLSWEQECALVARHQAGDPAAAAEIVVSYAPFLRRRAAVVSRNPRQALDLDDLLQEGRLALLEAARRFDPLRGRRLTSYARFRVRHRMCLAARAGSSVIRVGDDAHERLDALYKGGRAETEEDRRVAALLGVGELPDDLAAEDCPADERLARERDLARLPEALRRLPERERFVLEQRFLRAERDLADIGRELGVCRERARQIEARALGKLRQHMGDS